MWTSLKEINSFTTINSRTKTVGDFKELISSSLYPLFEIAEHMGEEYVWPRGTFVNRENLFLPYFSFSSIAD